jgi:hypothetical protein
MILDARHVFAILNSNIPCNVGMQRIAQLWLGWRIDLVFGETADKEAKEKWNKFIHEKPFEANKLFTLLASTDPIKKTY